LPGTAKPAKIGTANSKPSIAAISTGTTIWFDVELKSCLNPASGCKKPPVFLFHFFHFHITQTPP
jgi:hypothetical protein